MPEQPLTETSFETSLSQLQQIVADLESGQLGLEASLARFEQGIGLLRHCYQALSGVEQKIALLTRIGPDGAVELEEFDASATFTEPTDEAHGSRRRRKGPRKPGPEPTSETSAPSDSKPPDGPRLF